MAELSPARTREISHATLELLAEHGFDKLTMDLVAARAHASKATLYRHWSNKEALIVAALTSLTEELPEVPVPDTGSLRGDLHALIDGHEHTEHETELLAAVLHACRDHPDLAGLVREHVMRAPVALIETILARAVERGEVAPDHPALRFVLVSLVGPKLLRELVDDAADERAYLRDYVDALLLPALGLH